MDEETLKAAQEAEAALKQHDNDCADGCSRVGHASRGDLGRSRCETGLSLWDALAAFRPEELTGDRHTPDGEKQWMYVVEKVEQIGPYEIAYLLQDASGLSGVKSWVKHRSRHHKIYVDGKFQGSVWGDIDIDLLLLAAIEFRRNGDREGAAYYAAKVLNVPVEDD